MLQDVGPAVGGGEEGFFVPPVKGTSQNQVTHESSIQSKWAIYKYSETSTKTTETNQMWSLICFTTMEHYTLGTYSNGPCGQIVVTAGL